MHACNGIIVDPKPLVRCSIVPKHALVCEQAECTCMIVQWPVEVQIDSERICL